MTQKHKMAADSVGTFVQRVLGEMVVRYVNVYIIIDNSLAGMAIRHYNEYVKASFG